MPTKAQQKQIEIMETFFGSDGFNEMVDEGCIVDRKTLKDAFQCFVEGGGLKKVIGSGSTRTSKKTSGDVPNCCARTFNNKGELDGKPCGRSGTETIKIINENGEEVTVHVCKQHSRKFPGNYKNAPQEKKQIPHYCQGCSELMGEDVIHECYSFQLIGTICGTVCGVCVSRLQCHSDYDGQRIGDGKPKRRSRVTVGGGGKKTPISDLPIQSRTDERDASFDQADTDVGHNDEPDSEESHEETDPDEWEQCECDIGEGEKTYWSKTTAEGDEIWQFDDSPDGNGEFLGIINGDGEFHCAN